MKTIKISRSLLDEKEVAEIFKSEIGQQVYLAVGSSHIRSQFFNRAILNVVRYLTGRKTLPKTVLELQLAFRKNGRGDHAAQEPWFSELEFEPPENPNWNGRKDRNNKRIAERNAKFQELLDALNGNNPWVPDWIDAK